MKSILTKSLLTYLFLFLLCLCLGGGSVTPGCSTSEQPDPNDDTSITTTEDSTQEDTAAVTDSTEATEDEEATSDDEVAAESTTTTTTTSSTTVVESNAKAATLPEDKAGNITFTDSDYTLNELGGTVSITKAANEDNITDYVLYWGSNATTKLAGQSAIKEIAKTGSNLIYTIPANTAIPTNATYLLVFTKNSVGEMSSSISTAIIDVAVPQYAAQGVSFTDTDITANEIAGNVSITKASNETDITHYVLYYGSNSSTKLSGQSAISTIAKSGSNLTYAIPANTAIPTNATYLLVYTKNAAGEMESGVSVTITDVVASSNANLSALTLSSGTVAPAFSAAITSYTASVGIGTSSITVTPTKEQSGASITVNGSSVTSGNASSSITMNLGTNTITVVVTAEDQTTQKTYTIVVTRGLTAQEAYMKASSTGASDFFGYSTAISGDTIVVGAYNEDSNATGINGDSTNNSAADSGAAYVFTRSGSTWSQQAYLKASNTGAGDNFGNSVAISGDTIVVGAYLESSNATGVGGNQTDNSASNSGAAYVFTRSGTTWSQQAYLKASNTGAFDKFGNNVGISGDTIVVSAYFEDSNATGVGGNQSDNSVTNCGAAYVFTRSETTWSQQAYLKASNTEANDQFGWSTVISGDTIAIASRYEDSSATGIDGNASDNSASNSGAVYVFARSGSTWSQQAYIKASNTEADDSFGWSVGISGDTIVVGAYQEDGSGNSVDGSGAAYVFTRSGTTWSQQAYLKASNLEMFDYFGWSVAISSDTIVVGAYADDSNATGIDGDQNDNTCSECGAAYVFTRSGSTWTQRAYLKASNPGSTDYFGIEVKISGDTIVVGAYNEDSNATGINGTQSDNSVTNSGAVYVFK